LFPGTAGEEASKTNQPVCANSTEEDLVPLGSDDFLCGKLDGLRGIGCIVKDAAVAYQDRHDKEGAGEIAEEGDGPVFEHLEDTGAAM
jgi:hypothetical protein